MADARTRESWNHTSAILALIANVNRDPKKTRPFVPADLNPFEQRSPNEPAMRVNDLSVLKRVFVDREDFRLNARD